MLARRITERIFGIDPRSLAAFRIGLGLLLLVDLSLRARDLAAHYADFGVLPREVLAVDFTDSWRWSLHLLSGSSSFQAVLFAIAALLAMMLTLGTYTRLATVGSWILLTSLHVRNPLVLNGGDGLLRVLLFWSIFLPLDDCWSLAARRGGAGSARCVVSPATAAIMIQVLLVYFMSGYFKWEGSWTSSDTLKYILESDCYAKPLAYELIAYPRLLAYANAFTLWSELVIPLLVLSPFWTKPIRMMAIVWFGFFHLGIELTLTVGLFSYVSWLAWLLFVPSDAWDWLAQLTRRSQYAAPNVVAARRRMPTAISVLVGLLLGYVLWLNLTYLNLPGVEFPMPSQVKKLANLTGLRQKWNLFPYPLKYDGWYIAVGRLENDQPIDLLRDGAEADWDSYKKPRYIYRRSPNHRWRKMFRRLTSDRAARYREPLCRYLIRQWNLSHPPESRVVSLELHFMQEMESESDERFQQRFMCDIDLEPSSGMEDNRDEPTRIP